MMKCNSLIAVFYQVQHPLELISIFIQWLPIPDTESYYKKGIRHGIHNSFGCNQIDLDKQSAQS